MAREHLPSDIIDILERLRKADNIPFNQLYSIAKNCADILFQGHRNFYTSNKKAICGKADITCKYCTLSKISRRIH